MTQLLRDLASFGTAWLYLLVPLAVGLAVTTYLIATGARPSGNLNPLQRALSRAGSSLERVTGLAAWCAGGLLVGVLALLVAVIGFVWDVAIHIDHGRDDFLWTPGHLGIVVGLGLILAAAVVSVLLATLSKAPVGRRIGPLRVPHGALALGVLGAGAFVGFPLDELWHRAYGIDVTMWGPTHLIMISGASFTPVALWLLLAEAGPDAGRPWFRRTIKGVLSGALLVGLSTFQLEFDLGVPQFQALYQPLLIALAASVAMVATRTILGPGGALRALAGFLAIRAALAVMVGGALGLTTPRFPLYAGAALAVELVFWLGRGRRPLPRALAAGAAVATAGLATEWAWIAAWGRHEWTTQLFPALVVAIPLAVAGAILGTAMGRVASHRDAGMGARALVASAVAIVALLALPLPRTSIPAQATVRTTEAGPGEILLEARVEPASAVRNADWFEVLSWQGGASRVTPMVPAGDGVWRASGPIPVGGSWKNLLRYAKGDVMQAIAVSMPADPEIEAAAVPVVPERTERFVRDTKLLLREAHDGPVWPGLVAYGFILAIAVVWFGALGAGYVAQGRRRPARTDPLHGVRTAA